jgi:hypothetical protein
MPHKAHIESIEVEVTAEGRFVVETYDDGYVVRRKVESDGTPRRRPRKPFVRDWKRDHRNRTK